MLKKIEKQNKENYVTVTVYETEGNPEDCKKIEEISVDDKTTIGELKKMILEMDAYKDRQVNDNKVRIRERGGILVFG